MILHRITANFRRQDWTAVGIELIVVGDICARLRAIAQEKR